MLLGPGYILSAKRSEYIRIVRLFFLISLFLWEMPGQEVFPDGIRIVGIGQEAGVGIDTRVLDTEGPRERILGDGFAVQCRTHEVHPDGQRRQCALLTVTEGL